MFLDYKNELDYLPKLTATKKKLKPVKVEKFKTEIRLTKNILIPILIPLILFLGLVKIHDVLYNIYPMNRPSNAFGMTVYYSWIIFGILLLIFNIYIAIDSKNKYIVGLIFFFISLINPLDAIAIRPFRVLLMIIMFLSGFGLSIITRQINLKLEKLRLKIVD